MFQYDVRYGGSDEDEDVDVRYRHSMMKLANRCKVGQDDCDNV